MAATSPSESITTSALPPLSSQAIPTRFWAAYASSSGLGTFLASTPDAFSIALTASPGWPCSSRVWIVGGPPAAPASSPTPELDKALLNHEPSQFPAMLAAAMTWPISPTLHGRLAMGAFGLSAVNILQSVLRGAAQQNCSSLFLALAVRVWKMSL